MNNEYKCQCLTCKHIRQMRLLIPDEDLCNEVLAVTDGLYEAMASESIDLQMQSVAKDKKIKELEAKIDNQIIYTQQQMTMYEAVIEKLEADNEELEGTNRMWKDEIDRLKQKVCDLQGKEMEHWQKFHNH